MYMDAVFVELSAFTRNLNSYLTDDEYRSFQQMLLDDPTKGDVIQGTGGLRKVRYSQPNRGKGSRGGVRVIYYWWLDEDLFYLFTIYNKGEMSDLSQDQKKQLKKLLEVIKDDQAQLI